MILLPILTSLLCISFLVLATRKGSVPFGFRNILQSLKFIVQKNYTPNRLQAESIMKLSHRFGLVQISFAMFFLLFLLLPLVWGLSLYLRTDANVLFVIFTMVWSYNWIKFILQPDKSAKSKPDAS